MNGFVQSRLAKMAVDVQSPSWVERTLRQLTLVLLAATGIVAVLLVVGGCLALYRSVASEAAIHFPSAAAELTVEGLSLLGLALAVTLYGMLVAIIPGFLAELLHRQRAIVELTYMGSRYPMDPDDGAVAPSEVPPIPAAHATRSLMPRWRVTFRRPDGRVASKSIKAQSRDEILSHLQSRGCEMINIVSE